MAPSFTTPCLITKTLSERSFIPMPTATTKSQPAKYGSSPATAPEVSTPATLAPSPSPRSEVGSSPSSSRNESPSRFLGFCILAAAIGGLGWSGHMSFAWLPLLMPFVYISARTRIETLSVGLYYLAATWPVIPGAHNFFGAHAPWPMAYGLWLLLALFGTLPWVLFFDRRAPQWSALAAIVVLALPPFSLVTVGFPLIA